MPSKNADPDLVTAPQAPSGPQLSPQKSAKRGSVNGRTSDTVRREIEAERLQLATAVEQLREASARRRTSPPSFGRGCQWSPPGRSAPVFSGWGGRRCVVARKGRER